MGIVNGTTNYILTRMTADHMEFSEALALAAELGYAEADPTADIEGFDAARKVAILASIAFNSRVTFQDVATEGITKITAADISYASELGMVIKLLGVARNTADGIEVGVYPMLLEASHPLATVNDSFNAVFVHGDAVDDAMFLGRGAGKLPTGSAVVADIIEAAQNLKRNVPMGWTGEKQAIESMDQAQFRYFVRVAGSYRNKEQDVKSAFGQVEVIELYGMDEFAFLTAQMTEGEFKKGAVSYDARERERSEYGIKQMIRAVL